MGAGLVGQELARAVIDVVESNPNLHRQAEVWCGTTACLAGWAIALHLQARPGDDLDKLYDSQARAELYARYEYRDSNEIAAALLGIPESERGKFDELVFSELHRPTAIENFKRMTGIA